MGVPYLNSDESIILSTHYVHIDAVPSEIILTSRHLIIVDSGNVRFQHKEIPFAAIATVTTGESGSGDPAISLAVKVKSGGTKPLQMVFSQQPHVQRTSERDEWAQKIKEQITFLPPGTPSEVVDFEEETEEKTILMGAAMGSTPGGNATAGPERRSPPKPAAATKNMYFVIAAVAIIVIVIAGAVFLLPKFLPAQTTVPPTPLPTVQTTIVPLTTTAAIETIALPVTTPEETPVIQPTVTATLLLAGIPSSGTWVRLGYEGKYTGTIGTGGRLREVSGTGGRLYQVPASSTDIVEVSIQKLDTSGLTMDVEIYNNGIMIKRKSIITPMGTLVLTADLKTSLTPVVTPAATP